MNKQTVRTRGRTFRETLQRSVQVYRDEGVTNFLCRALAFLGYKGGIWVVGWYVRRLDSPIEPSTLELEASLTELTDDDIEDYLHLHPTLSSAEYLERLHQGQSCYALRESAGTLITVTWTAVGRVLVDFIGRELTLKDDQVYLYDSYTAAEFRGKHLQPFICEQILTRFRDRGYRQAILIIGPENRSNISSRKHSGFVRAGLLFRFKIGSLCYNWSWHAPA